MSQPTVSRVRKQYCEEGLEAALNRRPPNREYHRKLDGEQEARLVALACSRATRGPSPLESAALGRQDGRARDRRGGYLLPDRKKDSEKNELKPHLKKQWSIPPKANAEFVWRMEDVLEVYTRPYDPLAALRSAWTRPQSNCSGTPGSPCRWSRVRPETARLRVRARRGGQPVHVHGATAGRRWVDVTEQRTKIDWAHQIKELVDVRYPEAERIVLVMDNLNTHTPASLYEAFDPQEARRLARSWRSITRPSTARG